LIKVGIIGCGQIAEKHLAAYKKMPEVEPIVSDIDLPRAEAVSRTFDVEYWRSPEALLQSDQVHAVDICVPTPYHGLNIVHALDCGKHVFCEKPLVENLSEGLQIQQKSEEVGRMVMVGYLYRFHPAFQLVKQVMTQKVIGAPYFALFRLGGRGSHRAWKHQRETGGGALNEMLVHMLDLILWYFGSVESVRVLLADTLLRERYIKKLNKSVEANAEDLIVLHLETSENCAVVCESDLVTPSYMNHIEIQGHNGSIYSSILEFMPTIVYCKEPRGIYNEGSNFFQFPRVDLFEQELTHFLECARNGEHPRENSLDDSIRLLRVIEQIRQQVQN
jgi:predicted dehydrogenase